VEIGNTITFKDYFDGYKKGWIIYIDHRCTTVQASDGSIYFSPPYIPIVTRMVLFEKFIK
jgi:hypothetical protein